MAGSLSVFFNTIPFSLAAPSTKKPIGQTQLQKPFLVYQKEFLMLNIMPYLARLGQDFSKHCKAIGNSVSINAVLQRSNNDAGIKPMEW